MSTNAAEFFHRPDRYIGRSKIDTARRRYTGMFGGAGCE
jgi:hypothetical protein